MSFSSSLRRRGETGARDGERECLVSWSGPGNLVARSAFSPMLRIAFPLPERVSHPGSPTTGTSALSGEGSLSANFPSYFSRTVATVDVAAMGGAGAFFVNLSFFI